MPTSTLHGPTTKRPPAAPRSRRHRTPQAAAAVALVRVLTVLVGLATAAITLGPRQLVLDGRTGTELWLDHHPTVARLADSLGGVEAAGNVLLFVPFAALLALAVALRFLPVAFVALACSPLAVEWAQRFLPGRVPDVNDIVRNVTGLLVAFISVAVARLVVHAIVRIARRR